MIKQDLEVCVLIWPYNNIGQKIIKCYICEVGTIFEFGVVN